jgi:hypothetical protein
MDKFIVEYEDGAQLQVDADNQEEAAAEADRWHDETVQYHGAIVNVRLA